MNVLTNSDNNIRNSVEQPNDISENRLSNEILVEISEMNTTVKTQSDASYRKRLTRAGQRLNSHLHMNLKRLKCSCMGPYLEGFIKFHFKNWHKSDKVLIVFHLLSILVFLSYGTIDTVMYLSPSREKNSILQFVHGLRYIPIEIMTIIYGSSVAAFGICIEVYFLIVHALINVILIVQNCDGSDTVTNEILWFIKLLIFFPGVELCHRNFRKLPKYDEHFNSSARSMLRQALLLSIPMLVENLNGLKALYRTTSVGLSPLCKYQTSHCGIIDMYRPLFSYDNDMCSDDLSAYVAGREQIRLLRDFILLNITSYSVFNKHFLKIKSKAKYLKIRILLVILFLALGTSTIISYVDPLFFIAKCRMVYTVIESSIFLIILILMIFNLYKLRHQVENLSEQIDEMDNAPTLLP